MVDVSKINANLQYSDKDNKIKANKESNDFDTSIFSMEEPYSVEVLRTQLADVQANNGVILDGLDDFKNFCGLGVSSFDCNDAIEQYKQGKMTFEQAQAKISEYKEKQDSSLDLFSNIGTGVAAIVAGTAAVMTGGIAPLLAGVLVGAGTKAGLKTADRATNKLEGDALNCKQIAKDALSGAVTGGIAVATAGTGGDAFANGFSIGGKKLVEGGTKACVVNSAVLGVKTGALSGASNNLIDCAFEENKEFNFTDFAKETATGAVVGATVGTVMGGFNGTLRTNNLLKSGGSIAVTNTAQDTIANSACNAEYKLVNKAIRSVAA